MLDQSYSAENFEKIFNIENRKGNIKKKYLSSEYFELLSKIKKEKKILLEIEKKKIKKTEKESLKKEKYDIIENLKEKKEKSLLKDLKKISTEVNKKDFKIIFSVADKKINGKKIYSFSNDINHFYVMKQLQYNLHKTFKVKQADRFSILNNLKLLVGDEFPKIIVRTDIKSFYESISQNRLLEIIENNTLLTHQSKKFINSIIDNYESLKNNLEKKGIGIPRGIGVSAYLSELYMKDIDNEIKSMKNISFYARYVDDIIIIFTPDFLFNKDCILKGIIEIIEKNSLLVNEEKTEIIDLTIVENKMKKFSYLGYKFIINNKKLSVSISDERIERYKIRIKKTIEEYNNKSKFDEKKARKELFNRLKLLSGNTKLLNSKKGTNVGFYYSNSLLTKMDCVKGINLFFENTIDKKLVPYSKDKVYIDKLKNKIKYRFNFMESYKNKKFYNFSTEKLNVIKKIW